MNYSTLWQARWQMMRPGNAVMAAVATLVGGVLVTTDWWHDRSALAAALAAFLITGFGNILNDIRDIEIDRIAHPERPLPSGTITPGHARGLAAILALLGLYEAYVAAGIPTLLFAAVNIGILVGYEAGAKQLGLPGNVLVGALVASTFLFGAVAAGGDRATLAMPAALAVMAFLVNVARELQKDVQDLEADKGRATFPMQAGETSTLWMAFVLVQVAVALSVLAFLSGPWSAWWGLPLLLANVLFVLGSVSSWVDVEMAQTVLKGGMLVALLAFAAAPFL